MNKQSAEGMLGQDLGATERGFREVADDLDIQLHGKAREIAGRMQSAYNQVKDQAAETFSGVDAFVCERPYLSVAIAVAAGAVLGFVLGVDRPRVIVIRQLPAPRDGRSAAPRSQ